MGLFVAVAERLVKREVRQRKATQRRLVVIAGVDADGAVKDIDSVSTQSSAQRQECRWCVAKEAGFSAIVLIEIHISRPEQ